jgi:hypothetical protein
MLPDLKSAIISTYDGKIFKLDIEDINNIKAVGDTIKKVPKITIFPNEEKAFIGSSISSSPLYILDMVH